MGKKKELTAEERADILLSLEQEADFPCADFGYGDFDFDFGKDSSLSNEGMERVQDSELEKDRWIATVNDVPVSHVKFSYAIQLARRLIPKPEGYRYDCIVGGTFIFGDFLEAWMRIHNLRTDNLRISTLSYSQDNVDSLKLLADFGYFKHLTVVVSAYFFAHEEWRLIKYLYDTMGEYVSVCVASIHTKTAQFISRSGQKVVIHGSANMRSNGNIEQFTVETAAGLYDMYDDIFSRLEQRYAIFKKPISQKDTWRVINN